MRCNSVLLDSQTAAIGPHQCLMPLFSHVQMSSSLPVPSLASAAEPPLLQDLLEHILSFLPLCDLASALAVSKSWIEAAECMPDAQLTITEIPASLIRSTRLTRHISDLVCGLRDMHVPLLNHVLLALPSLRHLSGSIGSESEVALIEFPSTLAVLSLSFSQDVEEADVNRVLSGLSSQLTSLRQISLDFAWTGRILFEPLQSLPALTSLSCAGFFERWTHAQLAAMASLPHLLHLELPASGMDAEELRFFVSCTPGGAPPQWETLHCVQDISDEVGRILSTIETLTTFQGACTERLGFLDAPRLSNLTRILLDLSSCASSPAEIISALHHRSSLVLLELAGCRLNSRQLQWMLQSMPALQRLFLSGLSEMENLDWIDSLRCKSNLAQLVLLGLNHLFLDARHFGTLFALKRLSTLNLAAPKHAVLGAEFFVAAWQRLPRLEQFIVGGSSVPRQC